MTVAPAFRAVFFLSGAAGLLFETLWFRQAALLLGSSVLASSLRVVADGEQRCRGAHRGAAVER
jgi:inner membrane protein involved in colicin E2 resistance